MLFYQRTLCLIVLLTGVLSYQHSEALDDFRLDPNVSPTFQRIELTLDPAMDGYSGFVRIELQVTATTRTFRFHARDLDLQSIRLMRQADSLALSYEIKETGIVYVTTGQLLLPGAYTLTIAFTNDYNRQGAGLYKVETEGRSYLFSQMEAIEARTAFPCWDEPAFKFPYQMVLTTPDSLLAVSNMPVESETSAGFMTTHVFKTTPPMSSYLIAIIVGMFDTVPIPDLPVPGRVICVKGHGALAAEAVKQTPPIFKWLENYFGRPYPYDKLDLIAAPEFIYGAMENPGAIVFVEGSILMDEAHATINQRGLARIFSAHEIAHMWFGDLVTMAWWDDLWLNESFASWISEKAVSALYPELESDIYRLNQAAYGMTADAAPSARYIRQPVEPRLSLSMLADALTYEKGSYVLGMVETWLGEEKFRAGIRHYLKKHEWKNCVADDLWAALSEMGAQNVAEVIAPFVNQPGIPRVTGEWTDGKLQLSQERHLPFGQKAEKSGLWRIPIKLRYRQDNQIQEQTILMTEARQSIALKGKTQPDWIHLNADEMGYYHWLMPVEMMSRMAADSTLLSLRERVMLSFHLTALLDGGQLDGSAYLNIAGHTLRQTNPHLVRSAGIMLEQLKERFITPELAPAFADYVRWLYQPAFAAYGLQARAGEVPRIASARMTILGWLAREGEDLAVRGYLKKQAETMMKDLTQADHYLLPRALTAAALDGDSTLFEQYRRIFEQTSSPFLRTEFLTALGQFEDATVVRQALAYSLSDKVRPQEVLAIAANLHEKPQYRDLALRWVMANYDAIRARIAAEDAIDFLDFTDGCDPAHYERGRAFFMEAPRYFSGAELRLANIGDAVKTCADLRAREGAAVVAYLKGKFK